LKAHEAWLLEVASEEPDLILGEIRTRLIAAHGVEAGLSSLWLFFDRHGISFKKVCARPSRIAPTWPPRERWRAEQPSLDPVRLVFVDETGTANNQNQNSIRRSSPNVKEGAARPMQQNRH
jgi:hypothetical protein